MRINHLKIQDGDSSRFIEAERINFLSPKEATIALSALSLLCWQYGAEKENIKNKKNWSEGAAIEIEAEIGGEKTVWGRTFNPERKTFSDTGIGALKKASEREKPLYLPKKEPYRYQDGDYSGKGRISRDKLYGQKPLFLERFVSFWFVARQKAKDESDFQSEFEAFLSAFRFKCGQIDSIEFTIDEEKSGLSMHSKSGLAFRFWANAKEGKTIPLSDMNESDADFLLTIGEFFARSFYNKSAEESVVISEAPIERFYLEQLAEKLPKTQFFVAFDT